jgi:hypothetical protein
MKYATSDAKAAEISDRPIMNPKWEFMIICSTPEDRWPTIVIDQRVIIIPKGNSNTKAPA